MNSPLPDISDDIRADFGLEHPRKVAVRNTRLSCDFRNRQRLGQILLDELCRFPKGWMLKLFFPIFRNG